jgi:photosynthetic reaction center cytochrome c subunit
LVTVRRAATLISGLLCLGIAIGASSQDQALDSSAASALEGSVPRTKPVNIKVLPRDISGAEIGKIMKRFETDLGVKCNHCHVEDPNTRKFDYASDENPAKNKARLMITMLKDINEKYLSQLGEDRRYAAQVTCGSCHQGQSSPPAFD